MAFRWTILTACVLLVTGAAFAQDGAPVSRVEPVPPKSLTEALDPARQDEAPVETTAVPQATSTESLPLGRPKGADATKDADGANSAQAVSSQWWRTAMALALVVGAILLVAMVFKAAAKRQGGLAAAMGAGGRAPSGVMEVLGRYPVSRGQTLVLLRLDRRVLLLCQSASRRGGSSMQTLSEISDPEDVASLISKTRDDDSASASARFSALLGKFGGTDTPDHPGALTVEIDEPRQPSRPNALSGNDAVEAIRRRLADMRTDDSEGVLA